MNILEFFIRFIEAYKLVMDSEGILDFPFAAINLFIWGLSLTCFMISLFVLLFSFNYLGVLIGCSLALLLTTFFFGLVLIAYKGEWHNTLFPKLKN